jgi:hypothetical protein
MMTSISLANRCFKHQQTCGRGVHRESLPTLIDTRLTQSTVSMKKARRKLLSENNLG